MSKSKKTLTNLENYDLLKNNLIDNCKESLKTVSELNDLIISTLKPVENNSDSSSELDLIKKNWMNISSEIDDLKKIIDSQKREKNNIIKKMDKILNSNKNDKKDSDKLEEFKSTWFAISNKISDLNSKVDEINKDRNKLIKKAESYLDRLELGEKNFSKKKINKNSKIICKENDLKKMDSKEKTSKEKNSKEKISKEKISKEKISKEKISKNNKKDDSKISQINLQIDESDSEIETSDSDTDTDVSSNSGSDSDSED